jgi:hypothetical protein
LETYERGKNMPYISAIERMGEAKGKVEPIGLQLARQVGAISAETIEEIKKLPIAPLAPKAIEQLDQLALDLMDFKSIVDLSNWLQQQN